MKALGAILALWVLLLGEVGCRGGGKVEGKRAQGVESPKLEVWNVPVVGAPKLVSVRAITVDRVGAIWIGTFGDGIRRYDRNSGVWTTFTEKDGLANNSVHAIAVDGMGAIWAGTAQGLSRYIPGSRTWSTFTQKNGLADNTVQAIAVDSGGAIWVGTRRGGLSRYDPNSGAWTTFTQKDGLANNFVQTITVDGMGAVWIGTWGSGVSRYDPNSGEWTTFTSKEGLANNFVRTIAVDRAGAIWVGTWGSGVSRYDIKSRVWATFTLRDSLADDDVRAIAVDRAGAVWAGTGGRGGSRYNPKSQTWTRFFIKEDGFTDSNVQTIVVDESGVLWFGTDEGGLSCYDPNREEWTRFTIPDGIANSEVQTIAVDREDAIWFGTFRGGVSRYDPKSGGWSTFTEKDGLASNDLRAIAVDRQGVLWFGTFGGGVSRYDPKSGGWSTFTEKDGLASNFVLAIAVDGKGTIWVGTWLGQVNRYDPKSGAWTTFTQKKSGGWSTVIPKDGPTDNRVRAIAVDSDDAIWIGMAKGGVSRYDPKSGEWSTITPKDGVATNDVRAIAVDSEGAIWVGTAEGGIRRYDPKTRAWKTSTLTANDVRAIAVDSEGAIWVGTAEGGISRYDPKTRAWKTSALTANEVSVVAVDRRGAIWIGTAGGGVSRVVPSGTEEAGALLSIGTIPTHWRVLASNGTLILNHPACTYHWKQSEPPIALPNFPRGAEATSLAPGPDGSIWVGTALGGLVLRQPAQDLQLTHEEGLPSMTVTALAPIPPDNSKVWVGTSAGAALVRVSGQELRLERTVVWKSMPTGPVDALAPAEDGSVFLAYNAIPAQRFLDSRFAEQRAQTHVFQISPDGPVREIPTTNAFAKSDVSTLAWSAQHGLWAATSAGLFVATRKDKSSGGSTDLDLAGFQLETGQSRLTPAPIRKLAIAPDAHNTLWMSIDRQGDTPPLLVGFRPGTGWVYNLPQEEAIDDLSFTDEGELVVLIGSKLAKGRVVVPGTSFWAFVLLALSLTLVSAGGASFILRYNSLAARIRRQPGSLRELPLLAVPPALYALHRARALDEVWTQLDLPVQSLPLVEPLASSAPPGAATLRALAELLGMDAAAAAEVNAHPHGLTVLTARLPYPAPLRGHPIAIVALDLSEARRADPARVRETLESALKQAGHRFELPFLLLADGDIAQDILPANLAGLHLGEAERKALLFARSPAHTLAGLLHTRGLLALSPYDTSGAVKEEQMFFGRVALLRELLLASSVQQIIVGPRRVGKTSLLQSLRRELPARRPDTEVVFLDLLGIRDPLKAARNLARQLEIELPRDADPETLLADLLRSRFQRADKKGVVLIDEADGLVEADGQRGFPLLGAMRSLQAEGICSFVLAGYLYLYREALNQRSPLYNFATLRLLGPLEPEAARDLALVPMQRLGVQYADPALPARLAERTGGYPSFVQLLCDALLKELEGGDLTLTAAHLTQAERSARVSGQLGDMFRLNAGKVTQIAVYGLLDQEAFTRADAEEALSRSLGRVAPVEAVEQALLELRVFGFAVEQEGRFSWAIPLLRETLQAADPARAAEQLVEELEQNLAGGGAG